MTDTSYTPTQAANYDEVRFTSPGGQWVHETEASVVATARSLVPDAKRILEVGCGTGRLLSEIGRAGDELHGIDSSEAMLEQFRNRADFSNRQPQLQLCETNNLVYPDNHFDFAFCIRVLSLLESREYARQSLNEMFRVLRPGGVLLVGIVNTHRWLYRRRANESTAIRNSDIVEVTRDRNGKVIHFEGHFFIGIPMSLKIPSRLVSTYDRIDKKLGALFPRGANQGYYTLRVEQ